MESFKIKEGGNLNRAVKYKNTQVINVALSQIGPDFKISLCEITYRDLQQLEPKMK